MFLLVLSFSVPVISERKEQKAEAVALVDDILIGMCITAVALTYGYLSRHNDKGPVESFIDAFGPDVMGDLRSYFKEVVEEKAVGYLGDYSNSFQQAAMLVKKEHKHAVVQDASGYKYVDETGNVRVSDMELPFSEGTYYFTDTLPANDPAYTSGNTISKETIEAFKVAVTTLSKPVVKLGKTVLDDIVDFVGASGVFAKNDMDSTVSSIPNNSEFITRYKDKTALIINGGTINVYGNLVSDISGLAVKGIILELRLQNGCRVYGVMNADEFSERNNNYSKSGKIECFTNYMGSSLILANKSSSLDERYFSDLVYNPDATSYDMPFYIDIAFNNNQTCIGYTSCILNGQFLINKRHVYTPIDSGVCTFINNGVTANYVIGEVGADGTISYSVYGETEEGKYIDGLDIGSTSVKVTGDVTVSDRILEQVMDNSLTVEEINNEIAETNETVRAIDHTVNNGFEKSHTWYEKIWNAITAIPSLISSLFEKLWDWLKKILDAITSIPSLIRSLFETLFGWLDKLWTQVKAIPSEIVSLKDKVGEVMEKIPSGIATALKDLFMELFVPDKNFFNDWGNNFKNSLKDKLPYDVYDGFFADIKSIKSSKLEDVTMTVYGKKVVVFPFSIYYKYEKKFDDIIMGFMFIVLIFYNLDQIYFLIRGTHLYHLKAFGLGDVNFDVNFGSLDSKK